MRSSDKVLARLPRRSPTASSATTPEQARSMPSCLFRWRRQRLCLHDNHGQRCQQQRRKRDLQCRFKSFQAGRSLTVVNSNVSDNDGSGVSNYVSNGAASATIASTTVSGNSAGGIFTSAGALSLRELQLPIALSAATRASVDPWWFRSVRGNSTISPRQWGTASMASGSQVNIVNSTISGNSAGTSGGGIYNVSFTPCTLQIARSAATRQVLAGAFITTGRKVWL